jgi:hypothetical protein
MDIKLDADDVTIIPIAPTMCDECLELPATHYVQIDLRGNGTEVAVAECCESCAENFADRLRGRFRRRLGRSARPPGRR